MAWKKTSPEVGLTTSIGHFPAVKKARAALQDKAFELLEEFRQTIKLAVAAGKYEEALRAQQWLLDHIPGEDGERLLEMSVDKIKEVQGQKGPVINIGFKLGGLEAPAQLPAAEIIDVSPERD